MEQNLLESLEADRDLRTADEAAAEDFYLMTSETDFQKAVQNPVPD